MNQDRQIKYPYNINFTYNNERYTHDFCEIVNQNIELTATLNKQRKSYLGVAIGGIKDKLSSLKEKIDNYGENFVLNVILYDGITKNEVFYTDYISLKDDGEIIEESYNKTNNN